MKIEKVTTKLSQTIKPMLCEKADAYLFNETDLYSDFLASRKFDGTRALFIKEDNKIILKGRSGYTYENKFKEIVKKLEFLPNGTILDGEICCETFQKCQGRCLTKDIFKLAELEKTSPAIYFVFDILAYKYEDLTNFSFTERQEYLSESLGGYKASSEGEIVAYNGNVSVLLVENTPKIKELWEKAQKEKWEGIILKNPNSTYEFKRNRNWLKLKCVKTKDLIFDRYTANNAGVRAVSVEGIVCQVSGKENSKKFLDIFNEKGKVKVEV
jgi:bifunctional non-homologous end joining protein LigD